MARFSSLWIGATLSPVEHLCIRSFLDHGHAFELYTYGSVADVPDGCAVLDANRVLGEDQIFAYRRGKGKGSYGAFANRFRYKLLFERGGWWVDTDVVCMSRAIADADVQLALEDEKTVGNAILRFPAGHPCMEIAYARATAAGQDVRWGQTGPTLMSELAGSCSLERFLVPTEAFYPIHWSEFSSLIRPDHYERVETKVAGATFLHLWNEMFRRARYNKQYRPPRGSYLAELFVRYDLAQRFRVEYVALGQDEPQRLDAVPIDGTVRSERGAGAGPDS